MLQLNHFDSRLSDSLSPDLQKVKKGRQNSVVRRSRFRSALVLFCEHAVRPPQYPSGPQSIDRL